MGYSQWGRKESDLTEQLHFTLLQFTFFKHSERPSAKPPRFPEFPYCSASGISPQAVNRQLGSMLLLYSSSLS